jgi:hypothetical protein
MSLIRVKVKKTVMVIQFGVGIVGVPEGHTLLLSGLTITEKIGSRMQSEMPRKYETDA